MSETKETHVHVREDGTVIEHSHGPHGHHHSHEQTKAVLNRLSRAIGHLESIKRMVEDGRDCSEVLIQLSAVKSAINNTGKVILKEHIEHCLVDAVECGDMESVKELAEVGIKCEPIRVDDYTGKKMTFFHDPDGLPLELHE